MKPEMRQYFDRLLAGVIAELPHPIRDLLDAVPLYVEDYPSEEVLRRIGATRQGLCGLYTGIPLTEKSVNHAGRPSDVIWLFRLGILRLGETTEGIDEAELLRQIRITILHELGHYHGLDEDDLERLGYG